MPWPVVVAMYSGDIDSMMTERRTITIIRGDTSTSHHRDATTSPGVSTSRVAGSTTTDGGQRPRTEFECVSQGSSHDKKYSFTL